jgi:hypothetical protein
MHELLVGTVGSTAYGLNTDTSDIDTLAVFARPTADLHGLTIPDESIVSHNPDRTAHEVRKFCHLARSVNPTITELMWLPDRLYQVRHPLGNELIGIRRRFLSARRVRAAYLGYATQQFRRLEARGDGSFSADTRKRTAKHARHLMRLCAQGLGLYAGGRLDVVVTDPEKFHTFGERVAAGDIPAARSLINAYEEAFDSHSSPLPDAPDLDAIDAYLRRVRLWFLPAEG